MFTLVVLALGLVWVLLVSRMLVQPVLTSKEEMPPAVAHALQALNDDEKVAEVVQALAEVNWLITKSRTYAPFGDGFISNLCLLVSIVNA